MKNQAEDLLVEASLYSLLAKSFTGDAAQMRQAVEDMLNTLGPLKSMKPIRLLEEIRRIISSDPSATEEYVRLFDMGVAPPYETSYTCIDNPHRKTFEEADISGFYKAFGMRAVNEMPDHLSVELEFLALLNMKESLALLHGDHPNAAVCREAKTKFLNGHLLKWVEKFKQNVDKHAKGPLYPLLLELVAYGVYSGWLG